VNQILLKIAKPFIQSKVKEVMRGKKTYAVGTAMILSGLAMVIESLVEYGWISDKGLGLILEGFGFMTIRAGVKKVEDVVKNGGKPQ